MKRGLSVAILLLVFCADTAWPKFGKDEQAYLDIQFRAILEQVRGLKSQVEALTAQLTELRQNQAQVQTAIIRQQRSLQDMDQLLSSLRISSEENFSGLKTAVSQLRADQQKAFLALTGQPAQPAAGTPEVATTPRPGPMVSTPPVVQGYITVVEGNTLTVDLGSAQGLHPGSRLAVYKASDQNTRVGVLEVTQVVDGGNSRARIVTLNPGVRPEFSDLVRLE